jgi:hypothetical protein
LSSSIIPTFLLNQRSHPLALCCNQIDHVATPILAFPRKPRLELMLNLLDNPRIKPFNQIKGGVEASFFGVIHLSASLYPLPVSWRNCSNSSRSSIIGPT